MLFELIDTQIRLFFYKKVALHILSKFEWHFPAWMTFALYNDQDCDRSAGIHFIFKSCP